MSALTLEQAAKIVDEALRNARGMACRPMVVGVLDSGGHLKAYKREDEAGLLVSDIAVAKAWTAVGLGRSTRTVAEQFGSNAPLVAATAAISQGRFMPIPGGVVIRDGAGASMGAVGVSGDSADNDEACAVAGIEAAGLSADAGTGPG
jgi:uncharacterized protein GlcG (DUF336 family)